MENLLPNAKMVEAGPTLTLVDLFRKPDQMPTKDRPQNVVIREEDMALLRMLATWAMAVPEPQPADLQKNLLQEGIQLGSTPMAVSASEMIRVIHKDDSCEPDKTKSVIVVPPKVSLWCPVVPCGPLGRLKNQNWSKFWFLR